MRPARSAEEADVIEFARRAASRGPAGGGGAWSADTPLREAGIAGPAGLSAITAYAQFRCGARLPPGFADPAAFRSVRTLVDTLAEFRRDRSSHASRSHALTLGPSHAVPSGPGRWLLRGEAALRLADFDALLVARVRREGGDVLEGAAPGAGLCGRMISPRGVHTWRGVRRGEPPPYRPFRRLRSHSARIVEGSGDVRAFRWAWIRAAGELGTATGVTVRWREEEGGERTFAVGPEGFGPLAEIHAHGGARACAVFLLERWTGAWMESRVQSPKSCVRR